MIDAKKADWDSVISALKEDEDNPVVGEKSSNILSPNRLDIIIRVLALNDLIHDVNETGVDIYRRWLLLSHGISEATKTEPLTSYFSDYSEKNGFESYCTSFIELYKSIKKNGFDSSKFLPLDGEKNLINGAHRLAVSLSLGLDVYVKDYTNIKTGWKWNCKRLSNAFSDSELFLIMKEYAQYKSNCRGIVIPCDEGKRPLNDYDTVIQELNQNHFEVGRCFLHKEDEVGNNEMLDFIRNHPRSEGCLLFVFQLKDNNAEVIKQSIEVPGIKMHSIT